jgi:hypothetical protein
MAKQVVNEFKDEPKQAERLVLIQKISILMISFNDLERCTNRRKASKTNPKNRSRSILIKVNFRQNTCYMMDSYEVVRSHWEGGIDNGAFSTTTSIYH